MNPSRRGLSGAAKGGIIVVVVLVVLAGVYLVPSALTGKASTVTSTDSGAGSQTLGLLSLFGYFSQMQVQSTVNGPPVPGSFFDQTSVSYLVLGKATFDSARYTKVEFSQVGVGHNVIAWFNSTGSLNRLDILGDSNYTGPGAAILAQEYTTLFGIIPVITDNATLLSMLTKVSENTTSIGPTALDISSYHLAAATPPYKAIIAQYATIPGTNQKLAVYLYEKTTDGTERTFQITSITK